MPSSRSGRLSVMQKKSLLHFMKKEPNLLKGTFTSEFTYQVAEQKWMKIAKHLNCLPGAHKKWYRWRKSWHDLKQHVKKRRQQNPKGTLAEDDEKLLRLLEEYQDISCEDSEMLSNAAVDSLGGPLKQETIFVEFVKSQSEDEELEETEKFQQAINTELESGTSDDEERKQSPKQHVYKKVFKKQTTIAEKMFKLKKSYYTKKLSIMQTYHRERIKIDKKNAESMQQIACALEKLAIKNVSQ